MNDSLVRLARFSLFILLHIIMLPYHLYMLGCIILAAAGVGVFMGVAMMFLVRYMEWPDAIAYAWGGATGFLTLLGTVYQHYVIGEE